MACTRAAISECLFEIVMERRRFFGRFAFTIQNGNIWRKKSKKNQRRDWRERRLTLVIHKDGNDSPRRMPKAVANKAVARSFMPLSSDLLP